MPSPTSWSASTESALTGVARVDALLAGVQWLSGELTYSFPQAESAWSTDFETGYGPVDGEAEPWVAGYEGLFDEDSAAVRSALDAWSAVAALRFTEVRESAEQVGDLRFAYVSDVLAQGAQAYAYYPDDTAYAGDVWFNAEGSNYSAAWDPGTYEYLTVLHEIGHALGLKHPFDAESLNGTRLAPALDARGFTLMSYSAVPGQPGSAFSFEPTTPMVLDIAAIQTLYGANTTYNADNTAYRFRAGVEYHQTIWDAGGVDTLVLESTTGGRIDLRAGLYGSRIGAPVYVLDEAGAPDLRVNNVWIAAGVTIENATGGNGADRITGNGAANVLRGSGGYDTLFGGAGADTLQGGGGHDTLTGGADDDRLNGGLGRDTLTGSAGADQFVFDALPGGGADADVITDFLPGTDRLVLDHDLFGALALDAVPGTAFRAGAGLASAVDADDRLLYDTTSGALYYDADGSGAQAALRFAVLGAAQHPELDAADFLVIA